MSKRFALLSIVCGLTAALMAPAGAGAATPIPGQYIVVLKGGATGHGVAADHSRSAGARVIHTYDAALHGYAARLTAEGLAKVKADPRVASVTQDVEGKPLQAQTLPTGVNRIDADLGSQLAGDGQGELAGPPVAIYDSGIDTAHPDLNVVGGVNCLGALSTVNDGTYSDKYGHGTHVAGIVGARDDLNGVVGVAPGVPLYSVRDVDAAGSGTLSGQLCGINWITDNGPALGIKVVNSSQVFLTAKQDDGNCGYSIGDVAHQAICRSVAAGITWVFGAGNSGAAFTNGAGPNYPQVLTVTAMADGNGAPNVPTTKTYSCGTAISSSSGPSNKKTSTSSTYTETDDKYTSFSSYAASTRTTEVNHTVAAPGSCIWSTFKGQTYGYLSGTSMASPHGAGTVELCIASGQCTGTPAEIIQKVRADAAAWSGANPFWGFTGDPLHSPVSGRYYGYLLRPALY